MNSPRNTGAFTGLAWVSFGIALGLMLIGIYTLNEPLMVKGYYTMGTFYLMSSSFVLQKVIRDNAEDQMRNVKKMTKSVKSEDE